MIQDYAELISEAQRISGITDLANRAGMIVGFAERFLNQNLRLQRQETRYSFITDDKGVAPMPINVVAIREVYRDDEVLPKAAPRGINEGGRGWAVQENQIITSEVDAPLVMRCYASIPSLEKNDTNFLLQDDPEIYLNAVLHKAYLDEGNMEMAVMRGDLLRGLIDAVNMQDEELRMSRTSFNLMGGP